MQVKLVGKQRLVLDLSCRKKEDGKYYVVTDRWQKFSDLALRCGRLRWRVGTAASGRAAGLCTEGRIGCMPGRPRRRTPARSEETLARLAASCDEFLVHGVDVEGMQLGIDDELVGLLGAWSSIPVTYAGGARTLVSAWAGQGLGWA